MLLYIYSTYTGRSTSTSSYRKEKARACARESARHTLKPAAPEAGLSQPYSSAFAKGSLISAAGAKTHSSAQTLPSVSGASHLTGGSQALRASPRCAR